MDKLSLQQNPFVKSYRFQILFILLIFTIKSYASIETFHVYKQSPNCEVVLAGNATLSITRSGNFAEFTLETDLYNRLACTIINKSKQKEFLSGNPFKLITTQLYNRDLYLTDFYASLNYLWLKSTETTSYTTRPFTLNSKLSIQWSHGVKNKEEEQEVQYITFLIETVSDSSTPPYYKLEVSVSGRAYTKKILRGKYLYIAVPESSNTLLFGFSLPPLENVHDFSCINPAQLLPALQTYATPFVSENDLPKNPFKLTPKVNLQFFIEMPPNSREGSSTIKLARKTIISRADDQLAMSTMTLWEEVYEPYELVGWELASPEGEALLYMKGEYGESLEEENTVTVGVDSTPDELPHHLPERSQSETSYTQQKSEIGAQKGLNSQPLKVIVSLSSEACSFAAFSAIQKQLPEALALVLSKALCLLLGRTLHFHYAAQPEVN